MHLYQLRHTKTQRGENRYLQEISLLSAVDCTEAMPVGIQQMVIVFTCVNKGAGLYGKEIAEIYINHEAGVESSAPLIVFPLHSAHHLIVIVGEIGGIEAEPYSEPEQILRHTGVEYSLRIESGAAKYRNGGHA